MGFVIDDLYGPRGLLARSLPHYEYRPQQAAMADAVYKAFCQGQNSVIEAATGVGKSLAYLIPAVWFAVEADATVLCATHTLNLQEQLFAHDIPLLQRVLPFGFTAEVFKGRSSYLCRRRLAEQLEAGDQQGLVPHLETLAQWADSSCCSGERSHTPRSTPKAVWQTVQCVREDCPEEACCFFRQCFYWQLRHRLHRAQLIVTNQAMLLADAAVDGTVLPRCQGIVVDEAHNLEDAAVNAFAKELSRPTLLAFYRTGLKLWRASQKSIQESVSRDLRDGLDRLWETGSGLLREAGTAAGSSLQRIQARQFYETGSRLADELTALGRTLRTDEPNGDEVRAMWRQFADFTRQFKETTVQVTAATDEGYVFWADRLAGDGRLHAAPIDVKPQLKQSLFTGSKTVVLTSATLTTEGSFAYLHQRVGTEGCQEAVFDSPFDYETQALLCIPSGAPHPRDKDYTWRLGLYILHATAAAKGQVLALFTSYRTMEEAAELVEPKLTAEGYTLLVQGDDQRQRLVDAFHSERPAVLFGTNSFWEGVDIPGDALRAVVITRLPFTVPDRPVESARMETLKRTGADPFGDYSVPQAVLRLKQGFGRLIRSSSDRGAVVVLDRRIITAGYGHAFLESLPPARCSHSVDDLYTFFRRP